MAGLAKEVVAAGEGIKTLVKDALPTSLVDVAFGSFDGKLDVGQEGVLPPKAPLELSMLAIVRAAAAAVKAKTPADAGLFRPR